MLLKPFSVVEGLFSRRCKFGKSLWGCSAVDVDLVHHCGFVQPLVWIWSVTVGLFSRPCGFGPSLWVCSVVGVNLVRHLGPFVQSSAWIWSGTVGLCRRLCGFVQTSLWVYSDIPECIFISCRCIRFSGIVQHCRFMYPSLWGCSALYICLSVSLGFFSSVDWFILLS